MTRLLSQKEWASKALQLRTESRFDAGTLTLQDGQWIFKFPGVSGNGDCTPESYGN